jgi:hypothetical protein
VAVAERFPAQKLALFESHFCIRQFNGESDKEEEEEEAAAADDELYSTCELWFLHDDIITEVLKMTPTFLMYQLRNLPTSYFPICS